MSIFLNFGEKVNGFDHRVINEREARASAGIMCLLGGMSLFFCIARCSEVGICASNHSIFERVDA